MRIGSQGFHNYSRNLGRMHWDSQEDARSREARREKLKRTLDALPWSIGELPALHDDHSENVHGTAKIA